MISQQLISITHFHPSFVRKKRNSEPPTHGQNKGGTMMSKMIERGRAKTNTTAHALFSVPYHTLDIDLRLLSQFHFRFRPAPIDALRMHFSFPTKKMPRLQNIFLVLFFISSASPMTTKTWNSLLLKSHRSVDWFEATGPLDLCELPAGLADNNDDEGTEDDTKYVEQREKSLLNVCKGVRSNENRMSVT